MAQLRVVIKDSPYSNHLDNLLALITYLALARWRSRSPNGLSRDLGIDESAITATLDGFPGLFRKSQEVFTTAAGPQNSYTLHARYAQRRPRGFDPVAKVPAGTKNLAALPDPESSQDGHGEELNADTLRTLLDFVIERARAERETYHQARSQLFLIVGVFVAAVASVPAAVIQAIR